MLMLKPTLRTKPCASLVHAFIKESEPDDSFCKMSSAGCPVALLWRSDRKTAGRLGNLIQQYEISLGTDISSPVQSVTETKYPCLRCNR